MESLRAGKSHGELGVWKAVSGFYVGGNSTGGRESGKQLGWERGVCTRVGLWEGGEVQVGEEPRRLCELTMGLAGYGGE